MRGKRRPPSLRVSSVAGPLPPCRVCGADGAGFHYGVNTCEACKGFFRRSLCRKEAYQSTCSNKCIVSNAQGLKCAKCRYAKCLSVGMSHNAIKTGRYTYSKRKNDLLEVLHLVENGKLPSNKLNTKAAWNKLTLTSINSSPLTSNSTGNFPSEMSIDDKNVDVSSTAPSRLPEDGAKAATPHGHQDSNVVSERLSPNEIHFFHSEDITMPSSNCDETATFSQSAEMELNCANNFDMLTEAETWSRICLNFDSKTRTGQDFPESPLSEFEGMPILNNPRLCELDGNDAIERGVHIPYAPTMANVQRSFQPLTPPLETLKRDTIASAPLNQDCTGDHVHQDVHSEKEFKEMIQSLVCAHRQYVTDSDYNECSQEYLQKKKDECFDLCQMKHSASDIGLLNWKARAECNNQESAVSTSDNVEKRRLVKATEAVERREKDVRQMVKFFKHVPEFKQLSLSTQVSLMRESFTGLLLVGISPVFDCQRMLLAQEGFMMCQHDLTLWGPKGVSITEKLFRIAEDLNGLELTYSMKVILKMANLFNPGQANEDERQVVEELHKKYTGFLLKMYKASHPEQTEEMSTRQIDNIIAKLQEITGCMRDSLKRIQFTSLVASNGRKAYLEIFDGHSQD